MPKKVYIIPKYTVCTNVMTSLFTRANQLKETFNCGNRDKQDRRLKELKIRFWRTMERERREVVEDIAKIIQCRLERGERPCKKSKQDKAPSLRNACPEDYQKVASDQLDKYDPKNLRKLIEGYENDKERRGLERKEEDKLKNYKEILREIEETFKEPNQLRSRNSWLYDDKTTLSELQF